MLRPISLGLHGPDTVDKKMVQPMMDENNLFNVTYDTKTDVLYVTKAVEKDTHGVLDHFGIIWRYDANDRLVGATVMDFCERWPDDAHWLVDRFTVEFRLRPSDARHMIEEAFSKYHKCAP